MTDKEIRIISRKKKELFEKANPIAILKLMFEKSTEENVKKNPEEAKEKIESFEAMRQMKMLDDLMEELGYEWDISQSLYVEKNREAKSYSDAWDAVTSSDEKTEKTIIHKIEVKDEKILKDLKDNPDLTIYVKNGVLSMKGHVKTGAFLSVICEMLNTISSSDKRNVKEFIDMWNYGTEDKELHLAMKKEAD